jgi:hypothetical protein
MSQQVIIVLTSVALLSACATPEQAESCGGIFCNRPGDLSHRQ